MVKQLTKQELIKRGISVEQTENGYKVYRTGKPTGLSKKIVTREVPIYNITTKHKYGKDKTYSIIVFSADGKTKSLLLSRVIYTWFIGDIPAGYDIDHIDNNPLNNNLSNLQLLTRKDNIAKRGNARNQFNVNWSDEDINNYKRYKKYADRCRENMEKEDDPYYRFHWLTYEQEWLKMRKEISDKYKEKK